MNRALNQRIAEHVFGATVHEAEHVDYWTLPYENMISDQKMMPDFSGSITGAFWAFEHMVQMGWNASTGVSHNGYRPWCEFSSPTLRGTMDGHPIPFRSENASTIPEAICLAAIKALAVEFP